MWLKPLIPSPGGSRRGFSLSCCAKGTSFLQAMGFFWLLFCYFFPPFQPTSVSAGLPADPEMLFDFIFYFFVWIICNFEIALKSPVLAARSLLRVFLGAEWPAGHLAKGVTVPRSPC